MAGTKTAMRDCLTYYCDNEHNQDRLQLPPYTWTRRQMNDALRRDWLRVGPGGWHILSDAGHEALAKALGDPTPTAVSTPQTSGAER
jgi:hypothetical protein